VRVFGVWHRIKGKKKPLAFQSVAGTGHLPRKAVIDLIFPPRAQKRRIFDLR
jgi:hypothetical protein